MNEEEHAKLDEVKVLLVRIEERQKVIKDQDLAGINRHLCALNSSVLKNTIRSVQNEKACRMLLWSVGGLAGLFAAVIGVIAFL